MVFFAGGVSTSPPHSPCGFASSSGFTAKTLFRARLYNTATLVPEAFFCSYANRFLYFFIGTKGESALMNYGRFAPSRFAPTQSRFAPTQSRFAPTQSRFATTKTQLRSFPILRATLLLNTMHICDITY